MTAPHMEIADIVLQAARASLPEAVTVGAATPLPRGADPFIGSERPLLLGATRWAVVSPGGILLGGTPQGMAAVLGFEVPARPTPIPPEDRKASDPPPPRWHDLVSEAARPAITALSHAIGGAVIDLAGLPSEWAATQVSINDSDTAIRAEVGPIPDAVVVMLHAEEHHVRLVVVVPGIFSARVGRHPAEAEVRQEGGGVLAKPEETTPVSPRARGALDRSLSRVPLDLSVEMGRARLPLAQVLHLKDGEVLELREAIDAPVALVTDDTPVARGDLEVSEQGTLILHVTSIPGRKPAVPEPRVVADEPVAVDAPGDDAVDSAGDETPAGPDATAPSAEAEASAASAEDAAAGTDAPGTPPQSPAAPGEDD